MNSFRYAVLGLKVAWKDEANFRVDLFAALVAMVLSVLLQLRAYEWVAVIGMIGLVLSVELLNTALEELCDMLQPHHDPHVAKIKDLGAAASYCAAIASFIVGCFVYLPHIAALL